MFKSFKKKIAILKPSNLNGKKRKTYANLDSHVSFSNFIQIYLNNHKNAKYN